MKPEGILETVLYAGDLQAIENFYREILEMEPFAKQAGRQLFYRCGNQVLLIFDPDTTRQPPKPGALPVPPHGATGEGHVCFRASAPDIEAWRQRLIENGVEIEFGFRVAVGRALDLLP